MDAYGAQLMEFERFLKSNRLVPLDKMDFYLNWVDKFMKEQKYCKEKIGQDSLVLFVNSMRKDPKYKDWQVSSRDNYIYPLITIRNTHGKSDHDVP